MKVMTVLLLILSHTAFAGTELTIYNVSDTDDYSHSRAKETTVAKNTRAPSSRLKPINATTNISSSRKNNSANDEIYEANYGDREVEIMDIINDLEKDL